MAGYILSKNLSFNKHDDCLLLVFFKNLLKTSLYTPYTIQILSGNNHLLRYRCFFIQKARTSYLAMLSGHYAKEKSILLHRQKNASKKLVREKEKEQDITKINFHSHTVGLIKKYDGCFSYGINPAFGTLPSQLLAFKSITNIFLVLKNIVVKLWISTLRFV